VLRVWFTQLNVHCHGHQLINAVIPYDRGDLVHEIHERGEIFSEEYVEAGTAIHGRVDGTLAAAIEKVQVRGE